VKLQDAFKQSTLPKEFLEHKHIKITNEMSNPSLFLDSLVVILSKIRGIFRHNFEALDIESIHPKWCWYDFVFLMTVVLNRLVCSENGGKRYSKSFVTLTAVCLILVKYQSFMIPCKKKA
jgi:hypothetical protein